MEEPIFSHSTQYSTVYQNKQLVHNKYRSVVFVHQITEVVETKTISKYLHMHVSYPEQAVVQTFIA